MRKLLKTLKKLKSLRKVLKNLAVASCLSACSATTIDYCKKPSWGKPICLGAATKEVVSYDNALYFVLHNDKLGVEKNYCENLRKNK